MTDQPDVKPGDWICIGETDAVVCSVHDDGTAEVVYLDWQDRAINEDTKWDGEAWKFVFPDSGGGYADQYPRLAHYVEILRRGKNG